MLLPTIEPLMDLAISEDLAFGDITSEHLFHPTQMGKAEIKTRQPAVISGITVAQQVFQSIDASIVCTPLVQDSEPVPLGTPLMIIEGPLCSLLKGERLALNFLQHLSGVATLTFQYVGAISGTDAKITHTRKTTPGLRELEIEAVIHGGGYPHRKSLSHAVLIKDNHIKVAGSVTQAVETIRENVSHTARIQVECDTLEQLDEALAVGVDLILLDNMRIIELKEAVKRANGKAKLEASGGVTLHNVYEIAQTGVDYISTSQITLSAVAVDIGLDFL